MFDELPASDVTVIDSPAPSEDREFVRSIPGLLIDQDYDVLREIMNASFLTKLLPLIDPPSEEEKFPRWSDALTDPLDSCANLLRRDIGAKVAFTDSEVLQNRNVPLLQVAQMFESAYYIEQALYFEAIENALAREGAAPIISIAPEQFYTFRRLLEFSENRTEKKLFAHPETFISLTHSLPWNDPARGFFDALPWSGLEVILSSKMLLDAVYIVAEQKEPDLAHGETFPLSGIVLNHFPRSLRQVREGEQKSMTIVMAQHVAIGVNEGCVRKFVITR